MRTLSRPLPALLRVSLLCCVAVAAGAAAGYGLAYDAPAADSRTYAAPCDAVWAAAADSLREAGHTVPLDAPPSGPVGRIDAGDVSVVVRARPDGTAEARVRTGPLATRASRCAAAAIHAGIANRVAPPRPVAAAPAGDGARRALAVR